MSGQEESIVDLMQRIDDWVIALYLDRQMHGDDPDKLLDSEEVAGAIILHQQMIARSVLALHAEVVELMQRLDGA